MKKIIATMILTTVLSTGFAYAGNDNPPQVPPCPDEYRDGLKP